MPRAKYWFLGLIVCAVIGYTLPAWLAIRWTQQPLHDHHPRQWIAACHGAAVPLHDRYRVPEQRAILGNRAHG